MAQAKEGTLILWSVRINRIQNKDFSFRKSGIHSSEFRITEEGTLENITQ